MTDKVQKIREEVERRFIENELNYKAGDETELHRMVEDKAIIIFIDSLQDDPVSEDFEEAAHKYADGENPTCLCEECLIKTFNAGAMWQKEKDQKK